MAVRVDWRTTVSLLGTILKALAAPLAVVLAVGVYYGEPLLPFAVPAALSLGVGFGTERIERRRTGPREAFLLVALAWLAVALVGALPFVIAGTGVLADPTNALFESMSGITTTGATVIRDFEVHSRSVLLWRAVLQWLGGLGVLVLAVGILSGLSVSGAQLMETETRTRDVTRLAPRIRDTARLLGQVYAGLTGLMIAVLLALSALGAAPAMTVYDAVYHPLTAVSTAGFSSRAESIGAFSPAVQWATIPFMFAGAINFVLLYRFLDGDRSQLRESEEFRAYLGIVLGASAIVATFLWLDGQFGSIEATVRHALFQVVSIITTTGYATVDFDLWSTGARHVLFLGMFVGGMAGSTTCSIKTLRWVVVAKTFRRDLFTAIHPTAITPVRLSGEPIDEETIREVYAYTLVSVVIFALLTVFLVIDAARVGLALDEFEAMGAAASTFLNIGPAFGFAGPYGSYAAFPDTTKVAMIVLMWVGRIEIVPVLVLFTPAFWRS